MALGVRSAVAATEPGTTSHIALLSLPTSARFHRDLTLACISVECFTASHHDRRGGIRDDGGWSFTLDVMMIMLLLEVTRPSSLRRSRASAGRACVCRSRPASLALLAKAAPVLHTTPAVVGLHFTAPGIRTANLGMRLLKR